MEKRIRCMLTTVRINASEQDHIAISTSHNGMFNGAHPILDFALAPHKRRAMVEIADCAFSDVPMAPGERIRALPEMQAQVIQSVAIPAYNY